MGNLLPPLLVPIYDLEMGFDSFLNLLLLYLIKWFVFDRLPLLPPRVQYQLSPFITLTQLGWFVRCAYQFVINLILPNLGTTHVSDNGDIATMYVLA